MPMNKVAFYGTAGMFAQRLAPHTEADPDAVLLNVLVMAGNVIGRSSFCDHIAGSPQYTNLYVCHVGLPNDSRKGKAWEDAQRLFMEAAPGWLRDCRISGGSTGEGLIKVLAKGRNRGKRGLMQNDEMSRIFVVAQRQGNTLPAILTELFHTDRVDIATKTDPLRVEGIHLSIIGMTGLDLLHAAVKKVLDDGFLNRFLWTTPWRTKQDASGGSSEQFNAIVRKFADPLWEAISWGKQPRVFRFSSQSSGAFKIYRRFYESNETQGGLHNLLSRAPIHVLRLASIFAMLDQTETIGTDHITAALEVWRYSRRSVEYLFSRHLPATPLGKHEQQVQKLIDALEAAGNDGLTRTQITRNVFGGNKGESEIDRILSTAAERIESREVPGKGQRPLTIYVMAGTK